MNKAQVKFVVSMVALWWLINLISGMAKIDNFGVLCLYAFSWIGCVIVTIAGLFMLGLLLWDWLGENFS